jgi:chromosome segregation protein
LRIKSLQVHGFKSFVDRTTFSFKDGVTAVVGPNGCGKSNVVDAIRWVMGEQSARRLRGRGMDDVIFAGSDSRPPIGMAEVQLTFDNEDGQAPAAYATYAEIQITRRLYRSGESEYLMNKAPARLKDIQDFFRDTGIGAKGYTIVEQGKVAEIVSAKADERRILIEEAAGITKYKARRREAEGKLKSTEQNLTRVSDVLREIKRQISSLERQAKKAARYKRLRETQRVLELSLALDERADLLETVDGARGSLTELKDAVTALTTQLAERELAIEEKRIAATEAEKEVARGSERLYGLRSEIKNLEGRIELARRERETLDESDEGRRAELERLREQLTSARGEAEQARDELVQLEEAVARQAENLGRAEREASEAQQRHAETEREREASNQALVAVLTQLARHEDRVSALADRRSEIDRRQREADREFEIQQTATHEAQGEQRDLETGLRNLLSERDRLQEMLVESMNAHGRAVERERETTAQLREQREKLEARRARLDSLREVVERREDVNAATRHLLEQGESARERYGLRGLVRDLLEVPADVERAVEAVLAERAEAIVVGEGAGALRALDALRQAEAGRGIFLVQSGADAVGLGTVPLGTPLIDLVRTEVEFESTARALLQDVYLVDSLGEVFEHFGQGRLPATFVTRLGDTVTPDGAIRGGGEAASTGVISRVREVRELAAEVEALELEVARSEQASQTAVRELQEATDGLDNLRNRHHTSALALANHEKDLERTSERVKTLGEAQEHRTAERSELLAEAEALADEQTRLETALEEARTERTAKQRGLDSIGLQLGSLAREVSRLEGRVTELKVAHQSRVENRDRLRETSERAAKTATDTETWIERREREIEQAAERRRVLGEETAQAELSLSEKLVAEEEARVASDGLREAYEARAGEVRSAENAVRELRSALSGRQEAAATAELTLRESEMRLGHQSESIRDKWGIDLASWTLPPLDPEVASEAQPEGATADAEAAPTDAGADAEAAVAAALRGEGDAVAGGESDDDDAVSRMVDEHIDAAREARQNAELARAPRSEREERLKALRSTLESMGDVNLSAIEEHEELAERFRFLSEQQADLQQTIDSLREAIARINRTSRRRFRETFELVSKRFSENFPRLFGGGKASLELTETEDVLEAGIEIMAQPPGKRLQNVNLLSGGEKTMTALALLVAVFQVRPSPFFLLDEVDAALDDANVGRFNQLITEMAAHSQFLVITHNKRTIEVADVLYGVTMEQKGVSKLVSVELT